LPRSPAGTPRKLISAPTARIIQVHRSDTVCKLVRRATAHGGSYIDAVIRGIGVRRILSFHSPDFDEPELHPEWIKLL